MRERDRVEFTAFVSRRYAGLCRTAYLLTGSHHSAEDVVQSALVKAYVQWGRVRRAEAPEAYVRRMVVNELSSLRRRRWTRDVVLEDLDRFVPVPVEVGPEDAVVDRQEMATALASLTERQRAVVVLRYYDGLSEAEIADALGIRPGTVKGHARAGLAALGARLPADAVREDGS